jgi:hypothetical protein
MLCTMNSSLTPAALVVSSLAAAALGATTMLWLHYGFGTSLTAMTEWLKSCF